MFRIPFFLGFCDLKMQVVALGVALGGYFWPLIIPNTLDFLTASHCLAMEPDRPYFIP